MELIMLSRKISLTFLYVTAQSLASLEGTDRKKPHLCILMVTTVELQLLKCDLSVHSRSLYTHTNTHMKICLCLRNQIQQDSSTPKKLARKVLHVFTNTRKRPERTPLSHNCYLWFVAAFYEPHSSVFPIKMHSFSSKTKKDGELKRHSCTSRAVFRVCFWDWEPF